MLTVLIVGSISYFMKIYFPKLCRSLQHFASNRLVVVATHCGYSWLQAPSCNSLIKIETEVCSILAGIFMQIKKYAQRCWMNPKLNTSLESRVYETLWRYPTAKVEKNIMKLLSKHRSVLTKLKHKLAPYHSKPLHLYQLLKIQETDIPLRLVLNFSGSPSCGYALACDLHR
jgi:hypothetical protein